MPSRKLLSARVAVVDQDRESARHGIGDAPHPFQRQLYDCLHDYFVEMFIRTPQDLKERQARERG